VIVTNDEIAARKQKVIILFGLGVASFIAAYMTPEDTGLQSTVGVVFVLVGIGFMLMAAKFAKGVKANP
jgi:hypothetical protein